MPNAFDAFFERLTAASGDFNAATVGTLNMMDAVYMDLTPEIGRVGQTIRIPYPDVAAFTDVGVGDWTPEDQNTQYVEATLNKRPGKAILVRDFEQFQTAADLKKTFLDPMYKRAAEFANAEVGALLTAANFNAIPVINGTMAKLDISDVAVAWDVLTNNKVPISDASDSSLLYHHNLHSTMLQDAAWSQESLVGAVIAADTRQNAVGAASNQAFNFRRRYDQQAPTATAALTGTLAVNQGSATVTGTSTQFTTEAPVGSYIKIGADTNFYRVKAVGSNTSLTLAQQWAPANVTGQAAVRRTYTSVAMHRHAIALAVRPLELVNNSQVSSTLVMLGDLPVRVQVSYQHLKGGWLVTADYGMVAKVIRPAFGVVING